MRRFDAQFGESNFVKVRYPKPGKYDIGRSISLLSGDAPGVLPQRALKHMRENGDLKELIGLFGEKHEERASILDRHNYYEKK